MRQTAGLGNYQQSVSTQDANGWGKPADDRSGEFP